MSSNINLFARFIYIVTNQNTVFNYDKDTGFSLFDAFKPQKGLNEKSLEFINKIKSIRDDGSIKGSNLDEIAKSIGNVNVEVLNAAKAAQTGKKSWDDYETVVAKTSSTTFLYSLNKNNRKVLNQMHKDFNEKIENNFGLHKTDYPCECRLERQQKSCDDLRSRIRELETEML